MSKLLSTLNEIIHFSETNDFIQCANCHKFFPPDEEEGNKQTVKTTINDQQIPHQQQQFPTSGQKFSPFPQQPQSYPQSKQNHQQKKGQHQQGPVFPNKNQQFPQQHQQKQNIPQNKQKYPPNMNMNMGFPQKQNQPQGFYQQPFQQPYQQQIPHQKQQKGGFNQQQQIYNQKNIHGGFPMPNQQMFNQFRGNNQVFRARRKEINDYEMDYEDYDDDKDDNYITEEIYLYPSSAKKYRSEKKIHDENLIHKNYSMEVKINYINIIFKK